MKTFTLNKFAKVALAATAFVSLSAFAKPVTVVAPAVPNGTVQNFVLGLSNNAGFPSQDMGHLRMEQVGNDTKWTLSADWNNQYNSGNPFVFGLDYSMPSGSISQSSLPLFDVVGQVGLKSFNSRGVFFNTANNTNRFTDGEKVSWLFKNTNLSNFVITDLHVNAIFNGQSVKFAPMTPVPEPETYALMLAGLVGLGVMSKRRQAKIS